MENEVRSRKVSCEENMKLVEEVMLALAMFELGLKLGAVNNEARKKTACILMTRVIKALNLEEPTAEASELYVATEMKQKGCSTADINKLINEARRGNGQS